MPYGADWDDHIRAWGRSSSNRETKISRNKRIAARNYSIEKIKTAAQELGVKPIAITVVRSGLSLS